MRIQKSSRTHLWRRRVNRPSARGGDLEGDRLFRGPSSTIRIAEISRQMSSELKDRAELAFCKRPLAAEYGNGTGRARRREISRVSGIAGFARERERDRVWVGESLYDQNNSG